MTVRSLNTSFITATLICVINCCSGKHPYKKIEGDLYFSRLRIGSFYHQPDSIIQKVKIYADTVNRKLSDASDLRTLAMYEILKKENLLYRPFIDLKLDNDSIVKIYLTPREYDQIRIFHRQDLLDTKKKIRINLEVRELGYGMDLSTKIISVNKMDGQTLQVNKKFRIEDYH